MTMGGDLNALGAFPITWWIGYQDEEFEPEGHFGGHYPYSQPVRTGWQRKADGGWVASSEDPKLCEVFCEQCGDADGPAAVQPEPAQSLPRPYSSTLP